MKLWLIFSENKMYQSLLMAAISLLCLLYLTDSNSPILKWAFILNFSAAIFLSFYKLRWVKYCFYLQSFASTAVGFIVTLLLAITSPYIMLVPFQMELLSINLSFAVLFYAIAILVDSFFQLHEQSNSRLRIYAAAIFIAIGSYWLTRLLTHFFTDTFHYLPSSASLYENIDSDINIDSPFSIWFISWPISFFELFCAAVISFLLSLPFLKRWNSGYAIRTALVLPSLVTVIIFIQFISNKFDNKSLSTPFFEDWNFSLQGLIDISLGISLGVVIALVLKKKMSSPI